MPAAGVEKCTSRAAALPINRAACPKMVTVWLTSRRWYDATRVALTRGPLAPPNSAAESTPKPLCCNAVVLKLKSEAHTVDDKFPSANVREKGTDPRAETISPSGRWRVRRGPIEPPSDDFLREGTPIAIGTAPLIDMRLGW